MILNKYIFIYIYISSIMLSFNVCLLCLQGSDIETLGSEAAVEAELLERAPGKEAELQHNGKHLHNKLFVLLEFNNINDYNSNINC